MYKFVDKVAGTDLLGKMLKGGLEATVAGHNHDEVFVTVVEGEEWTDVPAWIRAIEDHYACVFDTTAE